MDMTTNFYSAWIAGFTVCASLIVSIGAQNLYVLRQAVQGEHVKACVALCVLSDGLLVALGVAGMAQMLARYPALAQYLTLGGAAFLLAYGLFALRRMWLAPDAAMEGGTTRNDERAGCAGSHHFAQSSCVPGYGVADGLDWRPAGGCRPLVLCDWGGLGQLPLVCAAGDGGAPSQAPVCEPRCLARHGWHHWCDDAVSGLVGGEQRFGNGNLSLKLRQRHSLQALSHSCIGFQASEACSHRPTASMRFQLLHSMR